jgi:hypothetical protein
MEVARWHRQSGQTSCGFYWVYLVRIIPIFEEKEISVGAYRAHESVFTKRRSWLSKICGVAESVPYTDATKPPDSLVNLFEKTVVAARNRARRDEELSVRARERREEF